MHACHSKVTHSDGWGALLIDVQVGELARRYRAPWLHGPGPAAERVGAGVPRAFGLPSAGLVFAGDTPLKLASTFVGRVQEDAVIVNSQ